MASKVALISGANKGIGKEAARQLGKQGFKVYLGSRDLTRGEAAAKELQAEGVEAEAIQLDVTKQSSVDKAIAEIAAKHAALDVLVNNAGILKDRAIGIEESDIADVEATMQTNFYGPLRLLKAATPLLEKSKSAKVVNVSSTLGSLAKASDPASPFAEFRYVGYNCSKAALNMLTILSAGSLAAKGIKVNSVCPGYVATDINQNQGYRTVEQGAQIIVKMATSGDDGPSGGYHDDAGSIPW
ncbi:MAG: SDR family oxidoreductase [Candidatus Obscuribacterales bacterium]|nr:SDR family oxidoreductase [Candidatus Obscuribacterales bacterium]